MFQLAFLIGIYSYIIFSLGILSLLVRQYILFITIFYLLLILILFRVSFSQLFSQIKRYNLHDNKLTAFLVLIISIQAIINLIGVLGPELAFDALWYHLTMPKIYLQEGRIFNIGGHLYYSGMPQLTEMYYLASLALGNEIVAKVIHFLFGIFSLIALYKTARLFLTGRDSILVVLVFYSNLVVGWMSITAYIDLARTFFEIMALWAFLKFFKAQNSRWLKISAVMAGFAISTKILSLGSVMIYLILLLYLKFSAKLKIGNYLRLSAIYTLIALGTALPWLIYSYLNTGNPIYPLFSSAFQPEPSSSLLNIFQLLRKGAQIFLLSPDPISPIYTISLPLIGLFVWQNWFKKKLKGSPPVINLLIIYVFLAVAFLYPTPIESSGRFILPYLPAFSILFLLALKSLRDKFLYRFLILIILVVAFSSIAYRGVANKRFIPYLTGKITFSQFLTNNLEFHVGNFYDIDGYFQKTIKQTDKVLIYGISNLYYINFPYVHESWVKKGGKFNYILIKDNPIPKEFRGWQLVYENPLTKIKLYSLNGLISTY